MNNRVNLGEVLDIGSDLQYKRLKLLHHSLQAHIFGLQVSLALSILFLNGLIYAVLIPIPLILTDLFGLAIALKLQRTYPTTRCNLVQLDRVFDYSANLITKVLICVSLQFVNLNSVVIGVPIYLSGLLAFFAKKISGSHQEKLINFLRSILRVVKVLLYVMITLKLEGTSDLNWKDVFGPLLFLSIFILFVSISCVFIVLIKLTADRAFYSNSHFFWLIFMGISFAGNSIWFCLSFISYMEDSTTSLTAPLFSATLCIFPLLLLGAKTRDIAIMAVLNLGKREEQQVSIETKPLSDVFLIKKSAEFFEISSKNQKDAEGLLEESSCTICYENKANSVFLLCFHGGLCMSCAFEVLTKKRKCHLCRQPIRKIYEIQLVENKYEATKEVVLRN